MEWTKYLSIWMIFRSPSLRDSGLVLLADLLKADVINPRLGRYPGGVGA